ncbi:MAG: DUF6448 family protein [Armatimonadota bacterium]
MQVQMVRMGLVAALLAAGMWLAQPARAHCDTMDGPVVGDAQAALAKGDVTPVLKWVKPANEAEIKAAFTKTLAVRRLGADAKELADRYFFETLVRVHRAGEGAPYTGLKPAGAPLEPGVKSADTALATGSADALIKETTAAVAQGIRQRFTKVKAAKEHADHTVDAGRKYVEAYVEYVHYVERLHHTAAGGAAHHAEAAETTPAEHAH